MTSKEKIEKAWELVNSKHIETNDEIQLIRYAVRRARELAERDTPKKVYSTDYYYCPNCDTHYLTEYQKFCDWCGQRLDWKEKK